MKIAVLFPGIGYTCDKPLLYYTAKICKTQGYEIMPVPYSGFDLNIKGNEDKMEKAFYHALEQANELLKDVNWSQYEEILFVSKSIGTIVAGAFAKEIGCPVRHVAYTPLEQTFMFAGNDGIMFHGTKDPWAKDSEKIMAGAKKAGMELVLIEDGNHSLETGDVFLDIENLKIVLEKATEYIKG